MHGREELTVFRGLVSNGSNHITLSGRDVESRDGMVRRQSSRAQQGIRVRKELQNPRLQSGP